MFVLVMTYLSGVYTNSLLLQCIELHVRDDKWYPQALKIISSGSRSRLKLRTGLSAATQEALALKPDRESGISSCREDSWRPSMREVKLTNEG